jgi:hypothetical protein
LVINVDSIKTNIAELTTEDKARLSDALAQLPGNSAPFSFEYFDGFRLLCDEVIFITYLPKHGWSIECPYAKGIGNTYAEAREAYNVKYSEARQEEELSYPPDDYDYTASTPYAQDDCPF